VECLEVVWDLGERRAATRALENTALLAESRGQDADAACFFGCALALREVLGSPMSPAEEDRHGAVLARLRERLGEEAFDRERGTGSRMSYEDMVEHALTWLSEQMAAAPGS
jgi:hypothetical protein